MIRMVSHFIRVNGNPQIEITVNEDAAKDYLLNYLKKRFTGTRITVQTTINISEDIKN